MIIGMAWLIGISIAVGIVRAIMFDGVPGWALALADRVLGLAIEVCVAMTQAACRMVEKLATARNVLSEKRAKGA